MKVAVIGLLVVTLLSCYGVSSSEKMIGGIGDEKPKDEAVQSTVNSVADAIKSAALVSLQESGANADATAFKASPIEILSYKTQLVAGTNYFVKLRISSMIFHARIYKHFSGSTELTKVVGPKHESEAISYFQ